MSKAASIVFHTFIYSWLLFSFFNDNWQLEGHTIIGAGILMMIITFVIFLDIFKIKGINHV